MPKINLNTAPIRKGSNYPAPFGEPCKNRHIIQLSDAGHLTQFGAHLVTLPPLAWASQRHHHSHEDELVYILAGHPTLIDDFGETSLAPGDACAHPAGDKNGHHLVNKTQSDVQFLVVGSRNPFQDSAVYPDIDLDLPSNGTAHRQNLRKDGTAY